MSILIITAQLWFSDVATEHHQQVVSVMPSFPYTDGNQLDQHEVNSESKRLRLMSEQANAAFNSPTTYQKEVQSGEALQWKIAIASKFKYVDEKKTCKILTSPNGQKVMGCKWVFAIKRDEHGEVQ